MGPTQDAIVKRQLKVQWKVRLKLFTHIIHIIHYKNCIIYLYITLINMFGDEKKNALISFWMMQKLNFLSENHSQILCHGACGLNSMATKI